jgi:2-methylcitrate dehydratase PrpD
MARTRRASRSDELVERVAAFGAGDIPAPVAHRAKLVLLDTLGNALAGSTLTHPTARALATLVREAGGRATASLVGQGRRTTARLAAFFNTAVTASGLTDPLHVATTMHAPAIVAGSALAAAEQADATGARLLSAFVLGVEAACRVSAALDPAALYRRGFHPTGICGTFGAAVAGGHALGLTAPELRAALGLALQQAGGSLAWVTDASDSARLLSPAVAAANGIDAARLAALGVGGPPAPFDGPHGAFAAFSGAGRPAALLAGWGKRFYVAEMTHKLHPSCSQTHAALDGIASLMREHRVAAGAVRSITLRCPPAARPLLTDRALRSCYAPDLLAVAVARGRVTIDDVATDRREPAAVRRLATRVRIVGDRALAAGYPARCPAIVELHTHGGAVYRRRVDAARGTPANPLTADDVLDRFHALATPVIGRRAATRVADQVGRLESVRDIRPLATLLRRRAPRR